MNQHMHEQQMIAWALRAKKLLLHLEKRQALLRNHRYSMAEWDEDIAAVEELINSYRRLFVDRRLEWFQSQLVGPTDWAAFPVARHPLGGDLPVQ
jgi:hypothetical protein